MAISFAHDRVIVPDRVVTRLVRAVTVLLNVETGQSFKLDPIGTEVWTALTSSRSIQEAYDALLSEFLVEPDQLKADLEALIDNLQSRGLLEVHRG